MVVFTYTYYGGASLATPIVYNLLKFIYFYVVLKEPHPLIKWHTLAIGGLMMS